MADPTIKYYQAVHKQSLERKIKEQRQVCARFFLISEKHDIIMIGNEPVNSTSKYIDELKKLDFLKEQLRIIQDAPITKSNIKNHN